MRFPKLALVGAAAFAATVTVQCRHANSTSKAQGLGAPTAEGLPITFSSSLPAQMAAEAYRNLPFLVEASDPGGGPRRALPVTIKCESHGPQENHCRLRYEGPEMKMHLGSFLFGTMAGHVVLSKGCSAANCSDGNFQMWWRTVARKNAEGQAVYDFEVCDIRGVEAKIGTKNLGEWKAPFDYLGQMISSVGYLPEVHGFRVSVEEFEDSVPAYDDNGKPKLTTDGKQIFEPMRNYRPIAAFAGIGPLGAFPNSNCQLRGEPTNPSFRDAGDMDGSEDNIRRLPKVMTQKIPAGQVKLIHDVLSNVANQSDGKTMVASVRCQKRSARNNCEINYRGPELNVPIPKYLTGAVDAQIVILRQCKNAGCLQREESVIKLASYPTGAMNVLEVCSMTGVELAPDSKYFPGFGSHLGIPDVHGATMWMTPTSAPFEEATQSALTKVILGVGSIGRYPTADCDITAR
jgi:hypothetical protein